MNQILTLTWKGVAADFRICSSKEKVICTRSKKVVDYGGQLFRQPVASRTDYASLRDAGKTAAIKDVPERQWTRGQFRQHGRCPDLAPEFQGFVTPYEIVVAPK